MWYLVKDVFIVNIVILYFIDNNIDVDKWNRIKENIESVIEKFGICVCGERYCLSKNVYYVEIGYVYLKNDLKLGEMDYYFKNSVYCMVICLE